MSSRIFTIILLWIAWLASVAISFYLFLVSVPDVPRYLLGWLIGDFLGLCSVLAYTFPAPPIIWGERLVWAFAVLLFGGVGFLSLFLGARSNIRDDQITVKRKNAAELAQEIAAKREGKDWSKVKFQGSRPAGPGTAGGGPGATAIPGQPSTANPAGGANPSGAHPELNPGRAEGESPAPPPGADTFPLYTQYQGQITDILEISPEMKIKYSNPNEVTHLAMQAAGSYWSLSDGRVGFKIDDIDEGSVLNSKLDLQNGDVIVSINGKPVPETVDDAWAMYNTFKDAGLKEAVIEVIRQGQRRVIYYSLP